MPKRPPKTDRFILTSDDFDKERAALQKAREARTAQYQAEMVELELKLAKLEAFETDALALSKRHAARRPKVLEIGKPKRPKLLEILKVDTGKPKKKNAAAGRAVPSGRPYTPEEDERLIAANRGEMPRIAEEMGRRYSAAGKRREVLLRKRREASSPQSVAEPSAEEALPHDPEAVYATDERGFDVVSGKAAAAAPSSELREVVKTPAPWEPATSEKRPIVEATAPKSSRRTASRADSGLAAAQPEASPVEASGSADSLDRGFENPNMGEWNGRPMRRAGTPVRGLTDDGPEHRRIYDPIAHASRSSE